MGDEPSKPITVDLARTAIWADLVDHAVGLLDHGRLPDRDDPTAAVRRVRPSDIAVLVRSNEHAQEILESLAAADVPSVLARGSSVLESPAADHLRWLLEALVRPSDLRRARTFALSWFGGWSPERLAVATDHELGELQEQLLDWTAVLTAKGPDDLLRLVWAETKVVERLLGSADGERNVTDLEHLVELLLVGTTETASSPAGLLALLDAPRLPENAVFETDADTDVASRRVETDDEAVQIMTVWVAKGLEFPIVLCPTMWSSRNPEALYHDEVTGERTFDATNGASWPTAADGKARKAHAAHEAAAEERRLLYVAMTRAQHHTAVWWAWTTTPHKSPLARVLFGRYDDGTYDPDLTVDDMKGLIPSPDETVERLQTLTSRSGGGIDVVSHGRRPANPSAWIDPNEKGGTTPLSSGVLDRRPDRSRSRWSFTAIKSRDSAHGDPWDLSIDDEGADDEQRPPDVGVDGEVPSADDRADEPSGGVDPQPHTAASSLAWLPAGAAFGTLAHDVLERVDFTASDLVADVGGVVADQQAWRSLSLRPVDDGSGLPRDESDGARLLTDGLVQVIETPLGPLFGNRRLRDIPADDRLDEMGFELPLDTAAAASPATDRAIGRLLLDGLAPDDPFRTWASGLADGRFRVTLAGHLTGSIDAVIRIRDDLLQQRFIVVDYKTNRLHDHGTPPVPGQYGSASMRASMSEHDYPLQALLYQVALHRYLRWRIDGYEPDVHLGGSAYLYLRGMTGAGVRVVDGHPDGVCAWAVPGSVIESLSDLLDGSKAVAHR